MAKLENNVVSGLILRPAVVIAQDYEAAIGLLVRKMCAETRRNIEKMFNDPAHAFDSVAMDDANSASAARILTNALLNKYMPQFAKLGKMATQRMVKRTLKNSSVTLGMSLREFFKDSPKGFTLKTDMFNGRLQEIATAAVNEGVSLIRVIPQKYIADVQGAVMRSISTGRGLKDLVPYLEKKYGENVRHARNVALDQTRKAYNNINAGRMRELGVRQFEWIHSGGGQHPRQQHVQWGGKIFDLDSPPVDERLGVPVIPGQAPNCRCVMRPIVKFGT